MTLWVYCWCLLLPVCCLSVYFTCISYSFLPGYNTKTVTILGHIVKMHVFRIGDNKKLNSEIFETFRFMLLYISYDVWLNSVYNAMGE